MQGKRTRATRDEGKSPIFRSVVCRLLADTVSAKEVGGKNMLPISDVAAEIEEVARDGTGNYLLLGRRMLSLACELSRGSPMSLSTTHLRRYPRTMVMFQHIKYQTYRISRLYRFSADTA